MHAGKLKKETITMARGIRTDNANQNQKSNLRRHEISEKQDKEKSV